jgi:hypothetical protein
MTVVKIIRFLKRPMADRTACLVILACFAVSRLLYFMAGVRFEAARPLANFFQIVDPMLLRDRLFETTWYMHTQPPALNFFIGLVLKATPSIDAASIVFGVCWLLLGVLLSLTLYHFQREVGVYRVVATLTTAWFVISPGVDLFENLLIYEYPLLVMLVAAALALSRFIRTGKIVYAATFFTMLLLLAYTRSLFHLLWVALVVMGCLWASRAVNRSKSLWVLATLTVALVFGLFLKNYLLYGQFTSSTWLKVNLCTLTTHQLPEDLRQQLVRDGVISGASAVDTPAPLSYYAKYFQPVTKTGIPILDQDVDSTGRDNFNNLEYFQVYKYTAQDAKVVVKRYPQVLLKSMAIAWFTYFFPTGDFPDFFVNRPKIFGWDRTFNVVFFGQWKDATDRKGLRREGIGPGLILYMGTYLVIVLPILFGYGCWRLWRAWKNAPRDLALLATLGFMLFNIFFVTGVANTLSSFENNRYRFPLDGYFVALFGMAVSQWLKSRTEDAPRGAGKGEVHPKATASLSNDLPGPVLR